VQWKLLEGIADDDRRAVLAATTRRKYRKGDTVFHAGDPGDSLHMIDRGRVAVRVSTPLGDVATVAVLGPGEFFGEQALVRPDNVRGASIVALEPLETLALHRRDFEQLRTASPGVERLLVQVLTEQVRTLTADLLDALYAPAERRVIRRLNDLVKRYPTGPDGTVCIPLTQEDLASMAGTTRPTTNRVLQELATSGIVILARGRTEVVDTDGLARKAR
jgi:CRP/FNR family transcriptional regulator, cyclic AMP receptor protein